MKHGGREDDSFCSAGAYIAYRIGTYPCILYVYNLSQDVEKCTLDLVISSCTRTNTIQGIALASKQCPKVLQDGLVVANPGSRMGALAKGVCYCMMLHVCSPKFRLPTFGWAVHVCWGL